MLALLCRGGGERREKRGERRGERGEGRGNVEEERGRESERLLSSGQSRVPRLRTDVSVRASAHRLARKKEERERGVQRCGLAFCSHGATVIGRSPPCRAQKKKEIKDQKTGEREKKKKDG